MEDVAREWRLRASATAAVGGIEAGGWTPSPAGGVLALAGAAAGTAAAASSPDGSVQRTTGTPPASPDVRIARSFVPHSSFTR